MDGTVSPGGRSDLRDWGIMNRPGKGHIHTSDNAGLFFAIFARVNDGQPVCRVVEAAPS